eukprot:4959894-Alexandrium_andersonii.AAC.1
MGLRGLRESLAKRPGRAPPGARPMPIQWRCRAQFGASQGAPSALSDAAGCPGAQGRPAARAR